MPTLNLIPKIRLIRPINCFMMGFAVWVGAYLANPGFSVDDYRFNLLLGFLTGFCLTGASMAVNDYFDRFIDAVNEPRRPIPSGAVKPSEALVYAAFLTILGFVASALIPNLWCLVSAIMAWVLSSTYMARGKRMGFIGNLMVSGCVATPFIYGSLVINKLNPNNLLFASMAFLSNTGREVTKGIADISGDKIHGVKSLAVLKGERVAAHVTSTLYLSAVGLSPLPWILGLLSLRYLVLVTITDAGFIISSMSLLRSPSMENAKRVKQMVLVWMFLGLIAFLLG